MCGILFQFNFDRPVDPENFNRQRDRLSKRGPDDAGTVLLHDRQVALGHRRLSIIDLSDAGHQPMSNEDDTVWLIFNGEIYNYKTLRRELQAKGHVFRSGSDSEVILHGYEEWGADVVSRLCGMFAFCIWDTRDRSLTAARDRFGIKPLYIYQDDRRVVLASEPKAILDLDGVDDSLDPDAFADYLTYFYVPAPKTAWKYLRKVEPSTILRFARNQGLMTRRYWCLQPDSRVISRAEASEHAWDLMREVTRDHLVSDVPVGLFLSGGYDSTALLALSRELGQKIDTYSIGFAGWDKSEHVAARDISRYFGTEHHELILDEDFMTVADTLYDYYDEPYSISSMVPYYYVSRLASLNHKVVMAGDGGDESFCGYRWYRSIHKRYQGWQGKLRRRVQQLDGSYLDSLRHFYHTVQGAGQKDHGRYRRFLHPDLDVRKREEYYWSYDAEALSESLSPVKNFQVLDFHRFVPENALMRADRSSMMNSLEVRVPYLDHRLVEYLIGLDEDVYFDEKIKKPLLHGQLQKYVPQRILDLPKRGFGSPLDYFSRNIESMREILASGELRKHNVLNPGLFRNTFQVTKGRDLWLLYSLEQWFRRWSCRRSRVQLYASFHDG